MNDALRNAAANDEIAAMDAQEEALSLAITEHLDAQTMAYARTVGTGARTHVTVTAVENGYLVTHSAGWGPSRQRVATSPRQAGEAVRAFLEEQPAEGTRPE